MKTRGLLEKLERVICSELVDKIIMGYMAAIGIGVVSLGVAVIIKLSTI